MKHAIFLSFNCEIFSKMPTARIFVGDTLIDEIEIPHFTNNFFHELKETKITKKYHMSDLKTQFNTCPTYFLEPYYTEENKKLNPRNNSFADICQVKETFEKPKIFVYVIDDNFLSQSDGLIRIIIRNNDSNYSNGFLTRSTLLNVHSFYIIPYNILKNSIDITQKYWKIYSRKSTAHSVESILKFYKERLTFPWNHAHYFNLVKRDKIISEKTAFVFGGDCELSINLIKKYKIWWSKKLFTGAGKKNCKGYFWWNHFIC